MSNIEDSMIRTKDDVHMTKMAGFPHVTDSVSRWYSGRRAMSSQRAFVNARNNRRATNHGEGLSRAEKCIITRLDPSLHASGDEKWIRTVLKDPHPVLTQRVSERSGHPYLPKRRPRIFAMTRATRDS